jgi:hypothetical protein
MKIKVEIDKLVLHGFTPQEQKNIQNMIIKEITNILKNQKQENIQHKNTTQPLTYNINTLKINTITNPQKIGHNIAHAIKNNTMP